MSGLLQRERRRRHQQQGRVRPSGRRRRAQRAGRVVPGRRQVRGLRLQQPGVLLARSRSAAATSCRPTTTSNRRPRDRNSGLLREAAFVPELRLRAWGRERGRKRRPRRRPGRFGGTRQESRSLGNSALLTAPVVLVYEVGLLVLGDRGVRNAADALIDQGLTALGRPGGARHQPPRARGVRRLRAAGRARKATPFGLLMPVILESALYACLLAPALMIIGRRMMAAPGAVDAPRRGSCSRSARGSTRSSSSGWRRRRRAHRPRTGSSASRAAGPPSSVLVGAGVAFSWFHHAGRRGRARSRSPCS